MAPNKCFLCNKKNPVVTLHKFPKNKENCMCWKDICGLKDYDVVTSLYICSEHFKSDDYCEPKAKEIGGLKLKPNRYPSVNVPKPKKSQVLLPISTNVIVETANELETNYLQINPLEPLLNNNQVVLPSSSSTFVAVETLNKVESDKVQNKPHEPLNTNLNTTGLDEGLRTPKKRRFYEPRYLSEVTSPDLKSPKRAKRIVMLAKKQLTLKEKRNEALRQENFRLRKKITSLEALIKRLKQKNVLSEDDGDVIVVRNSVPFAK